MSTEHPIKIQSTSVGEPTTYYISKTVGKEGDRFAMQYMHRDGKWHLFCGDGGMFSDEASAQAFLDKHKDKAELVTGAAFLAEKQLVKVTQSGLETVKAAMVATLERDVLVKALLAWYNDPTSHNTKQLESLAETINESILNDHMDGDSGVL